MQNNEIHKLFVDTFNTEVGKRCLKRLEEAFVDRAVYKNGQTFEQTAFREGQRDVVMQILKEVKTDG